MRCRVSTLPLTEGDPLPEDIDVDPEERREARGKEEIEARHPAPNYCALLEPLLCELAKCRVTAAFSVHDRQRHGHMTHVDMDTNACTPAFSNTANATTSQNVSGRLRTDLKLKWRRIWPLCRLPFVWSVMS